MSLDKIIDNLTMEQQSNALLEIVWRLTNASSNITDARHHMEQLEGKNFNTEKDLIKINSILDNLAIHYTKQKLAIYENKVD